MAGCCVAYTLKISMFSGDFADIGRMPFNMRYNKSADVFASGPEFGHGEILCTTLSTLERIIVNGIAKIVNLSAGKIEIRAVELDRHKTQKGRS